MTGNHDDNPCLPVFVFLVFLTVSKLSVKYNKKHLKNSVVDLDDNLKLKKHHIVTVGSFSQRFFYCSLGNAYDQNTWGRSGMEGD